LTRLGVITGLLSEAECLDAFPADERPAVRCAGADSGQAGEAARELITQGCGLLLSFGVAGGLDPALGPGTLVIADQVVAPDGRRLPTDAPWANAVGGALGAEPGIRLGSIAGSAAAITTVDGKQALHEASGSLAVDMESHAVANVAKEAGLPFLALRAIADPATRAIPPWVMRAVGDDGSVNPTAIIRPLLPRPWAVWSLIGLARENGAALATLRRVAALLGVRFGVDLR
jgi:adenosylhomocysteine nucleosidase